MVELYIKEDMTVKLTGFKKKSDGTPLNNATITAKVVDKSGNQVFTFSMAYVASSSGDYEGTIESTSTELLTENQIYYIEITASESPYDTFRRVRAKAVYRGVN